MKNKILKYSFGVVLLLLTLFAFCFSKHLLFFLAIFYIIVAMKEYRNMFALKEIYPHKFLPEITGILIALIFCSSTFGSVDQILSSFLVVVAIVVSFMITIIKNKKPYMLTTFSTIGAVFLLFAGLYMIKLTYFAELNLFSKSIVVFYIIIVLLSDYIASVVGTKFKNKRLLCEDISPNKTVAGAVAHVLTCIILSIIFIQSGLFFSFFFGLIVSIFAQFGDLAISTLKRDLGATHSGNMFLEHGGFLDRMDAFIFSAPAIYSYMALMQVIQELLSV